MYKSTTGSQFRNGSPRIVYRTTTTIRKNEMLKKLHLLRERVELPRRLDEAADVLALRKWLRAARDLLLRDGLRAQRVGQLAQRDAARERVRPAAADELRLPRHLAEPREDLLLVAAGVAALPARPAVRARHGGADL